MPIPIASDHAGLPLKQALIAALQAEGLSFDDLGTHGPESVDYPDFAHAVSAKGGGHRRLRHSGCCIDRTYRQLFWLWACMSSGKSRKMMKAAEAEGA